MPVRREGAAGRDRQELPDARLQLLFALFLGATLFGSLWAIADEGKALAASLVTTGVAVSLLPFLVHVLPPLARDARTSERDANYPVAVVGLFLYVLVVGGVIALINIDYAPLRREARQGHPVRRTPAVGLG
jgi:hypothetical protein